ncbi:MarR family winged helix-turn-helix transcriptional regulator [Streptomyces sp. NRRL S-340]|uniref:MarR family winged helix-turn-helix transcriptional regulator n=1 Tax=Streptomyces sp. NRRL S-340 TaxID=1463901 RepID=UPI00068F4516|nr:helix-turn-helix domain-containing protein [Streptomyces sp. NRRL S-340]
MDHDEPGLQLVHLLRAVTVELNLSASEFASDNGLHPTDVRALVHLLDADRAGVTATAGRLGTQLGINSASTTALIDRLERLGLVRRERDTRDRRRVLLAVTDKAVALGWSFFGPLIREMIASMNSFDAADLAVVRRFLLAMREVTAAAREAGREDTAGKRSPHGEGRDTGR